MKQQQGVALVIALVITAIAVSLASMAMYRQQLQIRLSGNISNIEQAYEYAVGMEDWSKKTLEQDYKDNPNVDHNGEDWATLLPPIAIPGGSLNGQLFDLQGKINLNALNSTLIVDAAPAHFGVGSATTEKIKISEIYSNRMKNLITTFDEEQSMGPAENFVDTVWDWVDEDDDERTGGAESSHYQSLEKPYMSANGLMTNITELRLLKGMTDDIYKKLRPFVSVLPSNVPVNVNTAPIEVLEAIGFSNELATEIRSTSDESPFESMNDFWELEGVKLFFDPNTEIGKKKVAYVETLTNTTEYFLLRGQVNINNTLIFINSILERKKGKVRVIMRDYSDPA